MGSLRYDSRKQLTIDHTSCFSSVPFVVPYHVWYNQKVAYQSHISLQKTPNSSDNGFVGLDHESVRDSTLLNCVHLLLHLR